MLFDYLSQYQPEQLNSIVKKFRHLQYAQDLDFQRVRTIAKSFFVKYIILDLVWSSLGLEGMDIVATNASEEEA